MTGKVVVAKNATTTQDSVAENFSATIRNIRAVRFAGGVV